MRLLLPVISFFMSQQVQNLLPVLVFDRIGHFEVRPNNRIFGWKPNRTTEYSAEPISTKDSAEPATFLNFPPLFNIFLGNLTIISRKSGFWAWKRFGRTTEYSVTNRNWPEPNIRPKVRPNHLIRPFTRICLSNVWKEMEIYYPKCEKILKRAIK